MNPDHPGNWPEDFPGENGNYQNTCCNCQQPFIGHKRRAVCKVCSSTPHPPPAYQCPGCGKWHKDNFEWTQSQCCDFGFTWINYPDTPTPTP